MLIWGRYVTFGTHRSSRHYLAGDSARRLRRPQIVESSIAGRLSSMISVRSASGRRHAADWSNSRDISLLYHLASQLVEEDCDGEDGRRQR